jgi:hypothetical protein
LPESIEGINTAKTAAQVRPRERIVLKPFFLPKIRTHRVKIIPRIISLSIR